MHRLLRIAGTAVLGLSTTAASATEPFQLMSLAGEAQPSVVELTEDPEITLATVDESNGTSAAWSGTYDDCSLSTSACMPCKSVWGVRAGAAILHRERPDDVTIAAPLGGLFQISAGSDFDFDYSGAADISIERRLGNTCNSIEVRYLGGLDWDSQVGYDLFGDIRLGPSPVVGVDFLDANYASTLDSTEINFRHQVSDRFTWLVGFRWVELGEDLNYGVNFILPNLFDFNWNTNNHLYGAQIGGDFQLWRLCGPLRVNSVMKAGIYGNNADNDFTVSVLEIPIVDGGAQANQTSFIGEIGVNASYYLTQNLAIRGGYQLLWIDGVALASHQAAAALEQGSPNVIDAGNSLFYHGALVGADLVW